MSWSVKNGWHEAVGQFTRKRDAQDLAKRMREANRQAGVDAGPVRVITTFEARGGKRKNPTKAQKRENSRKAAVQRRVAVALAKYLKQQNPGTKLAGAKVEKLKGGVLKITPIKANAAGNLRYSHDDLYREGNLYVARKGRKWYVIDGDGKVIAGPFTSLKSGQSHIRGRR